MFRSLPMAVRHSKTLQPVFMMVSNNVPKQNFSWGNLSRPMTDIRKVMQEMDRRMADLEKDIMGFSPFSPLRSVSFPRIVPIAGVGQKQDKFSVEINVSGFKPEEVNVSLKDGKLRVEANMDRTEKDGAVVKQSLVQEFTVPANLDISTVESLLHNNGLLEITGDLKSEGAKKIPITGVEEDAKKIGDAKEEFKSKF